MTNELLDLTMDTPIFNSMMEEVADRGTEHWWIHRRISEMAKAAKARLDGMYR